MSLCTGPGRNSEMSITRSLKVSGANLPTSSRCPGDSIWKQPRVWARWIRSKVGSSCHGTASRSTAASSVRSDLGERVGHRGLHPDPEHVQLEQPELLHVVLVELADREAAEARLDRRPVEQRQVAEQHPARVQGQVPGQPVEGLDQVEQQVQPSLGQPERAEFGKITQGGPGVLGPQVRKGLGDRVDLQRGQRERGADVADGMPDPVRVEHRHAGDPPTAEALQDHLVHLGAALGLHVEIDVGQAPAVDGQEPLHQQAELERLDPGDAEHVVDQAPRPGTAGGAADAARSDQVDDVGDGEEVRRVPELRRRPRARRSSRLPGLWVAARVARGCRPASQRSRENRHRRRPAASVVWDSIRPSASATTSSGRCGEPMPRSRSGSSTQLNATARVAAMQLPAAPLPPPGPVRDLVGEQGHLLAGLQISLRVAAVDVSPVECDQPTRGVEHVQSGRQPAVGHPDLVGENGGGAAPVGQREQSGGVGERSGSDAAAELVGDGDHEVLGFDQLSPSLQSRTRRGRAGPRPRLRRRRSRRRAAPAGDRRLAARAICSGVVRGRPAHRAGGPRR